MAFFFVQTMADSSFYLRNIFRLTLTIIERIHSVAVAIPRFLTKIFTQPTCAQSFLVHGHKSSLRKCLEWPPYFGSNVTFIYARHPPRKNLCAIYSPPRGTRGKGAVPTLDCIPTFIISLNCSIPLVSFFTGVQPLPQRSVGVQSIASTER